MSIAKKTAILDHLLLAVGLLVSWQVLYWSVGDLAMSSPLATVRTSLKLLSEPWFWDSVQETAKTFGIAYLIACVLGISCGVLLGSNKQAGDVVEPMLSTLYAIPKVTLYPVILILFGIGISGKIVFAAFHGLIPIIILTASAVRHVELVFYKLARVMRLSRWESARTILLPATLPEVITGLRIGFSLTMLGTLVSEMFGARKGVGFTLMNAIGLHNVDMITAVTFLLVVFAITVNSIFMVVAKWAGGNS